MANAGCSGTPILASNIAQATSTVWSYSIDCLALDEVCFAP